MRLILTAVLALMPGGAAAAANAAAVADLPPLAELAPDSTVFLAGTPNAAKTLDAIRRTPFGAMGGEELARRDADAAARLDELGPPAGQLAVAMFTVLDAEIGTAGPGYLVVSDYGARVDAAAEVVDRWILQAVAREEIAVDEREIAGRPVRTIRAAGPFGDDALDQLDAMLPPEIGDMMNLRGLATGSIDRFHLVREGTAFVMSSDLPALQRALEVVDGGTPPRLADRPELAKILGHVGPCDVFAALLTRDLGRLMAADDPMGMWMMVEPMLAQLVGPVDAIGFGMRFDTPTAQIETTASVSMPQGTQGLTSLMDLPGPRGAMPALVGADTVGYSAMNVDLARLPEALRPITDMLAMMMMPMDADAAAAPNPMQMLEEYCALFGKRVHLVQPAGNGPAVAPLMAIETPKPAELGALLARTARDLGVEGRMVNGHPMYPMQMDVAAMMPGLMADDFGDDPWGEPPVMEEGEDEGPDVGPAMPAPHIALAGDLLLIGDAASIETALAAPPRPSRVSMAMARAIAALSDADDASIVAWGCMDPAAGLAALDDVGGEGAAPMGPAAWEIRSTGDGFTARSVLLKPE